MEITKRKASYYYKYLSSYVIILIIPILFIALYVNMRVFKTLEEEVITNDINTLYLVKNGIESYHEQLKKIKEEMIYLDETPFHFVEEPLRGVERINQLRSYKITNPYLADVFLYYCGDKYIYTSTGSSPIDLYINNFFNYENWNYDDFYHTVNTIQKPLFRPVEPVKLADDINEQYATMVYPLSRSAAEPYAMLIFILPKEFFDSRINDLIDNNSKITVIVDDKDQIIASSTDEPFLRTDKFQMLMETPNALNRKTIQFEEKKYLAAAVESEKTGWKYITLTPQSNIKEKVKKVRMGFLYGIIFVIFIGVIFILVSMRINYNPIKKLKKYSEGIVDNKKKSVGELELVKQAIDFLSDQNALLTDEVEHSNEANKQYVTMQLLRGGKPLDKPLQETAEKYGIKIKECCTVAILHVNRNEEVSISRKEIVQELKNNFLENITVYECLHFEQKKIIMILSFEEQIYTKLQDECSLIQTFIKDKWNMSTAIGIGNCYSDKNLLPKAYIEASTAVDYRLVKGNGCVILFSEIMEQQVALKAYPKDSLEKISMFLKAGGIKDIEKELDIIISYIKKNNTPIFIARGLCFDIINLIFQTSQEIVSEFENNIDIPDVFTLSKYDTVDDLAKVVKKVSHDLCSQIIKQKAKEELSLIREMAIYIKNNYTDCNFSLHEMADYFNMSQSNLSMYFKDKTEQTILNYVTKLKMKRAKELLRSTDMTLTKVSEEVGYSNVTSFIRRFKQWEGITPGEYRKKYSL